MLHRGGMRQIHVHIHTQVHRAQVRCGLPRASYASEISEIERAADN